MSNYKRTVYLILLFVFSFFSVFWVLSIDNSFSFDDIGWMQRVSTVSYKDLFSFFPLHAYLDRPIGTIFLKFLYSAFELDYCRHHVVLVIIHLLNVLLTFLCIYEVFRCKYKDNDICFRGGIIAAGFFGIWSRTHMAVQWDAAIFDLLGTFWCLLAMLFYFFYRKNAGFKGQNVGFCLFFFYLSIRTKEMFLVFPILLVLYEVWEMLLEKKVKCLSIVTVISLFITIIFLGRLVYLKLFGGTGITNDISNPYYQSFNPIKMMHTLLKYAILCFDLEKGGWVYSRSISGVIGLIVLLAGLGVAFFKAVHNKFELLFSYLAIVVSIVIVLPMVNQVHVLYLYFPAIFVGLLVATVVSQVKKADGIVLILLCLFLATACADGNINTKNYWIENAKYEIKAWRDIENIEAPTKGATIYIKNVDEKDYSPFFYGEGAICKLLYHDESLNVEMLAADNWDQTEYMKPYVLWVYDEGRVREIERNNDRVLLISEVYKYPQEDGSLILSVVPNRISDFMELYVDGIKMELVIGETFTSASIPAELIKGKEYIVLKVKDEFDTLSDEYILQIKE